MRNPAICFNPEDYRVDSSKIMGRHAAGNGFLRAAVAAHGGQPLYACSTSRASADAFRKMVSVMDPEAPCEWLPNQRLDLLAQIGTLYLPGPDLADPARLRLRAGPAAYSLAGVTHTTASHGAMTAITGLISAPVMPWDALICTSTAVRQSVMSMLEQEAAFLRWRFGSNLKLDLPQFPVIPLGVHSQDYVFTGEQRAAARLQLGIADDEVVVLFVGRLSFHAKAHPHAMYKALQAAAERCGKKLVLLQCGWFANAPIGDAFIDGAAQFCPTVRMLIADGTEPQQRTACWAAGELFLSLADNLQETFGLTPVEAMAAGLPVVVSDWNGYKDTVREGVDGFRIPTWMPPAGMGQGFAQNYEAGADNYDFYCGLTCQTVSLDMQVLVERLCALLADPALRQRLGQAGQARAREGFDWSVVYRQYQDLWHELGSMRRSSGADARNAAFLQAAPREDARRSDPFRSFAHYPTRQIGLATQVHLQAGADLQTWRKLCAHAMFSYARRLFPSEALVERLLGVLGRGACSIDRLAGQCEHDAGEMLLIVAQLAKMDLLVLHTPPEPAISYRAREARHPNRKSET